MFQKDVWIENGSLEQSMDYHEQYNPKLNLLSGNSVNSAWHNIMLWMEGSLSSNTETLMDSWRGVVLKLGNNSQYWQTSQRFTYYCGRLDCLTRNESYLCLGELG
jgi:hypothetical protein